MKQISNHPTLLQKYKAVMPTGAGALFIIQMFSTLGFSVLYSTLVLYTTKGLKMNDMAATNITGAFIALNYFLHLLGGYIGGRFLSYRSLFGLGMLAQLIGCALISVPTQENLLWGLAVFLGGSGLNVTCINCMVTQLFENNDKRREMAFLWNYSGMNIGFFIGFTIAGYFHLKNAYQQLFLLSAIGNLIALILTIYHWKILKDRDTIYMEARPIERHQYQLLGVTAVILLIFVIRGLLEQTALCNQLILSIGVCVLGLLSFLSLKQPLAIERKKMWAFIVLTISALIFWSLYQLAPMGFNLFIDRNVDRHFLGFIIAPQWVQNINTIVIILGGPVLSFVFSHLRTKGVNINIPFQFSIALLLIGMAFAILPLGIKLANPQGYINFNWVLASFILQSVGELFLSPIGYAMVGELAPVRLRGLMMGTWMMIQGVAVTLSNHFSNMAVETTNSISPLITNSGYSHMFNLLGWTAISASIILFIFTPKVYKLTQEKLGFRDKEEGLVLGLEKE